MALEGTKFEDEMEVDGSESSSNNSNSPEAVSDDEVVDEGQINEIQEQIKSNPYLYEPHVQLIALLRKIGDLDRLRKAREEMSKIFPLTPELWLDWLTDEEKLAVTKEQKEYVIALFERSVKDYTSVSVWLEYVQYIIGQMGNDFGAEEVRSIFERALTAVGINVAQGALIWDAYREFECAMLSTLQASNDLSEEAEGKIKEQKKRIYNVFRRQLSVPLMYMDKTYEEFQELFPENKDPPLSQMYAKATKKLEILKPFEDALFQSEPPHLEEYKAYIRHERNEDDPVRVQNIFERALIENCLVPELWLEYTQYLDEVIKIEDITFPAYERAVRNCPWSLSCWKNYALSLERHNQPHDITKSVFERALNSGFTQGEEYQELWLGYLDYLRRCINPNESHESELYELRAVFERATEHLVTYYKDSDLQCSILQYWAKVEAKCCKNMTRAREIWNDIMNHGHQTEAEMWMRFANFERVFGDEKHYRKILLKGLHSARDWPESIGNLLLTFEREEGNLTSLDIAVRKYEEQIHYIQEKRQKLAEQEIAKQEEETLHKKQAKANKRASKSLSSLSQAKAQKVGSSEKDVHMDSEGFKIPLPPSQGQQSIDSNRVPPLPNQSSKRGGGDESLPPNSKKQKVECDTEHGQSVKHDPLKDERTVFLSNLAYNVDENKIKEMFLKVGDIEEVRLVKDYKGRSKGFCYIVFDTKAAAQNALQKDRERLDGRPMYVSPCQDKKQSSSSEQKFKFSTGLEKNKLFIKNLPFSTTEEDLKNIYKEFGTLKEVRLVTYRNGHSKGLAYVEYMDEASAATALVKTDGLEIEEHVISVAISNPPERRQKKDKMKSVSVCSSLGGGSSTVGPRGRGRTQVTLLPRTLQRSMPLTQQKASSSMSQNSVQNGSANSENDNESKKLGNDDFRRMLLSKK